MEMNPSSNQEGGSVPYSFGHVPQWTLELFAEDALPAEERDEVRAHVDRCGHCTAELEASRAFLASLAGLHAFEPPAGFADAVMARVNLRPEGSPVLVRVRRWLPVTRRGWMTLFGIMMAPLGSLVALAAWLLSHPLVTVGGLWSMGQEWGEEAGRSLLSGVSRLAVESGAWEWGTRVVETVWANPFGTVTLVMAFMALATPVSAWSLVRLLRTPVGGAAHAN